MEKAKIMVVDDEEEFLIIIKLNLERTGKYEVTTLSNPKEIISQVDRFKPDVILLDLLMPGLGGIDACKMLNDAPVGKKIPIIILSALAKYEDKRKAYKMGVVDYLVKPIEKDALVAKIEKALH